MGAVYISLPKLVNYWQFASYGNTGWGVFKFGIIKQNILLHKSEVVNISCFFLINTEMYPLVQSRWLNLRKCFTSFDSRVSDDRASIDNFFLSAKILLHTTVTEYFDK